MNWPKGLLTGHGYGAPSMRRSTKEHRRNDASNPLAQLSQTTRVFPHGSVLLMSA